MKKKKRTVKRALALFLALILCMGMSLSALADDIPAVENVNQADTGTGQQENADDLANQEDTKSPGDAGDLKDADDVDDSTNEPSDDDLENDDELSDDLEDAEPDDSSDDADDMADTDGMADADIQEDDGQSGDDAETDIENASEEKEPVVDGEEIPEEVRRFRSLLDAMEAFELTGENQEAYAALGAQVSELLEILLEKYYGYPGMEDDMARFQALADKQTGGAEPEATKWHTITLVPASTNSYSSEITSAKVKPGDKVGVGQYEVTSVSGTTIKVKAWGDLYADFFLPKASELWNGAVKSDYVIWAGVGSSQKTEGASAMLPQSNASAYYYFNTKESIGEEGDSYYWTFNLEYDANGGSGAPETQTYGTDDKYTKSHTFIIPDKKPVWEGYSFSGWSEDKDSHSPTYRPNGKYLVWQTVSGYNGGSVTKTLYAVWERNQKDAVYQVEWYNTDGEPLKEMEIRTGTVGEMVKVTEEDKKIDGYRFHEGNPGNIESAPLSENKTVLRLYFEKEAEYTVEWYDTEGNTIKETETRTEIVGETVKVTEEDKEVEGYQFAEDDERNVEYLELSESETVLKLYFTKIDETEPEPSPTPENPEPSPTPENPEPSPTPENPEPSPTPENPNPSPTPENPEPSPTPENPEPSPTPENPNPSPTPENPEPSPTPENPSPSPTPENPAPAPTPETPTPNVPEPTPNQLPNHLPRPFLPPE